MGSSSWKRTLAVVGTLFVAMPASAAGLTFSAPEQVAGGHALNGVACPSASFCIAVGDGGTAVTSSDPAGSAASWSSNTIEPSSRLISVACAGIHLCVATDNHARVLSSIDPAGGPGAWRAVLVDPGRWITGIACPSTKLCVVIDRHGGILTSTRPTGGARAWSKRAQISRSMLTTISCPTTRLCVATEDNGKVAVSTNPTGGKRAWRELNVGRGPFEQALLGVSCPTTALCAALNWSEGTVAFAETSTKPTSSRSWRNAAELDDIPHEGNLYGSVSCGSPTLCVAAFGAMSGGFEIWISTRPTRSWGQATFPGSDNDFAFANGIACARRGPCVIAASDGTVIVGH